MVVMPCLSGVCKTFTQHDHYAKCLACGSFSKEKKSHYDLAVEKKRPTTEESIYESGWGRS